MVFLKITLKFSQLVLFHLNDYNIILNLNKLVLSASPQRFKTSRSSLQISLFQRWYIFPSKSFQSLSNPLVPIEQVPLTQLAAQTNSTYFPTFNYGLLMFEPETFPSRNNMFELPSQINLLLLISPKPRAIFIKNFHFPSHSPPPPLRGKTFSLSALNLRSEKNSRSSSSRDRVDRINFPTGFVEKKRKQARHVAKVLMLKWN